MPGSAGKRSAPPNIFVDLAPSVLLQGERGHVSEGRVKWPVSKGQSPVP